MTTAHQLHQQAIIDRLVEQVSNHSLQISTVKPVNDFAHDQRRCLTSVHFPRTDLQKFIQQEIIKPLQTIEPDLYYYPLSQLHLTIKNVRVIFNPPRFNAQDIQTASTVFSTVIPLHHQFPIYFYRLMLFPHNLSIMFTTGMEFDNLILDLDYQLATAGLADDKIYANSRYFFGNITLARFAQAPAPNFSHMVKSLSASLQLSPYWVDTVALVAGNAALYNPDVINTWQLQS